jgi:hypothetical protein
MLWTLKIPVTVYVTEIQGPVGDNIEDICHLVATRQAKYFLEAVCAWPFAPSFCKLWVCRHLILLPDLRQSIRCDEFIDFCGQDLEVLGLNFKRRARLGRG